MTFQIHALPAEDYAAFFDMTDAELTLRDACRKTVDAYPGFPCRVTLDDAQPGEEVILVNHTSLDAASPYRASHAIYVRKGQPSAAPAPGEVPPVLTRRILSIRGFGADAMMRVADVVEGAALGAALSDMFANPEIAEIHIHNAKQGCYAARATRA